MNKNELASRMSINKNIPKTAALEQINNVLESIEEGLLSEGKVSLVNFGNFQVKTRKERTGRNPQTGEEIFISEQKNVTFKLGKALKEKIKNS